MSLYQTASVRRSFVFVVISFQIGVAFDVGREGGTFTNSLILLPEITFLNLCSCVPSNVDAEAAPLIRVLRRGSAGSCGTGLTPVLRWHFIAADSIQDSSFGCSYAFFVI